MMASSFLGLLLIGVVGLAYSVPRLVRNWSHLVSSTVGAEAIALFFTFVAYEFGVGFLLYLTLQHRGRAPVRLEILQAGFSLFWADGCKRDWNWASLKRRLTIDDLSMNEIAVQAQLQISPIRFCVLTKAACDAIEAAARSYCPLR